MELKVTEFQPEFAGKLNFYLNAVDAQLRQPADNTFQDGAKLAWGEYAYDPNGNLTEDKNKGISGIVYNSLNLPEEITFADGGRISYLYSAAGTKLRQVVTKPGVPSKVTGYVGGMVYENDKLLFFSHSEGRVVYDAENQTYEYQYNLKDHLGNVRLTFTTRADVEEYLATMEAERPDEEQGFDGFANTRVPVALPLDHTHKLNDTVKFPTGASAEAVRLNRYRSSQDVLPGITLKVNPGDRLEARVQAKYLDLRHSQLNASVLIAALSGASGYTVTTEGGVTTVMESFSGATATLAASATDGGEVPHAFISYYIFDEEGEPVGSDFKRVSVAAAVTGAASLNAAHEELVLNLPEITKAGYVRIELSHEAAEDVDIYFDDLQVIRKLGPVVQADDYYPFGMSFNSWLREGDLENKFQYNGKEKQAELGLNWMDYGARMYDAQLGRWHVVDPMTETQESWTPYHYVYNNPVLRTDPDGRCPDGDCPTISVVGIIENTAKDLAVSVMNVAFMSESPLAIIAKGGQTRAYRDENGTIQVGTRPLPTSNKEFFQNLGSDALDGLNVATTVATGGTGGAGLLMAKTGAKTVVTNTFIQGGKKGLNKNANNAAGNFVLYEVEEAGTVLKVGKANADDVMPTTGEIRRVHTSERKAQQAGYPNAKARVVDNLGSTTTGRAKEAEAARARGHRSNGNPLPLNKEKDRRYHN